MGRRAQFAGRRCHGLIGSSHDDSVWSRELLHAGLSHLTDDAREFSSGFEHHRHHHIHTPLVIKYGGTTNKVGAGVAVAFLFLFITFFAPGIDVTSYVCGAEIFPTYMRARGLSVTIATYFAFAALYVSISSTSQAHIGAYFNICTSLPLKSLHSQDASRSH